jgi:GGDEF domain-containing protein
MMRLAAATRPTDTITRLAPERIVLVAEGVSCGVHALVDVLRDRCERVFARPVCRGGMRYTVGPRVGAAVAVAGTAVTAEGLLAQAEAAMPAGVACVWARSEAR